MGHYVNSKKLLNRSIIFAYGAVLLQHMIERMGSVRTFRKKNTYTHNF